MPVIEITHLADPRLDIYARLTESQLRSRVEPEKGVFIAESPTVIGLALKAGYTPISFLMEQRHLTGQGEQYVRHFPDLPIFTGSRETLAGLTGYQLTRGILCAMERKALPSVEDVCQNARRIAVLEDIVDSTNIGAIFRSAAALGVDAVLVTRRCCDPLCRRSVRVSMGTIFQIPWTQISADWPSPGMEMLKTMGFKTAAMALTDRSVSIDHPAVAAEEKLAILLGTEGTGLSKETLDLCDYTVKIPMSHMVDSLNVAAASAVAFWELRRR